MDQLVDFLLSAHWQQTGQNTYFCDDPGLDTIWIKVAEQLPSQLKGCGLQAWKIKGTIKMVEPKGFIQSVSGEGAIVGGQSLTPESKPVSLRGKLFSQPRFLSFWPFQIIQFPHNTSVYTSVSLRVFAFDMRLFDHADWDMRIIWGWGFANQSRMN